MVAEMLVLLLFTINNYYKVCSAWRDIALTIRDKVFAEDEEQLIDIHDVKVCCPV